MRKDSVDPARAIGAANFARQAAQQQASFAGRPLQQEVIPARIRGISTNILYFLRSDGLDRGLLCRGIIELEEGEQVQILGF